MNDGQLPASDLSKGTSLRSLGRLFAGGIPMWVIAPDGTLVYLSAACGPWLGIPPQELLDRNVWHLPSLEKFDRRDAVAAALAPPHRPEQQIIQGKVVPPGADSDHGTAAPLETTFVPITGSEGAFVLALATPLLPAHIGSHPGITQWLEAIAQQVAIDPRRAYAPIMLGQSVWAERLRTQVQIATENPRRHVTIYAPRGSGGPLIARLIDLQGSSSIQGSTSASIPAGSGQSRAGQNWMVEIAGPLMDAELFDASTSELIERGFEEPDFLGTLVVDSIDQMPADAQQRLLGAMEIHADRLRVIATSTQAPAELATTLLPSLAARLAAIEILVPPLAARSDDLPLLATSLLQRLHRSGETPASQLSREALDRIVVYPWPGNFEELDAAIRVAARQCRSGALQVDHFPLAVRTFGIPARDLSLPKHPTPLPKHPSHSDASLGNQPRSGSRAADLSLDAALQRCERECLVEALGQARGNRAAAARLLGISRPRLLRRLQLLSITWPP